MNLKPTHLRECVRVIQEGDYQSAEDAVKAVIACVDMLRAADLTYIAVRQYSPVHVMSYGPYPTKNAAVKAAEKGHIGLPGQGQVFIFPLRSPQSAEAALMSLDELDKNMPRHHWTRITERISNAG